MFGLHYVTYEHTLHNQKISFSSIMKKYWRKYYTRLCFWKKEEEKITWSIPIGICKICISFKADTNNTVDINHRFSFPFAFETKCIFHPNPISNERKKKTERKIFFYITSLYNSHYHVRIKTTLTLIRNNMAISLIYFHHII